MNLSNSGKAVILISQDLEEIFELSDKICVINDGALSKILPVAQITAEDVGLLMGGKLDTSNKVETREWLLLYQEIKFPKTGQLLAQFYQFF